jgi:21S rRNA (uridine2791-2'-O)-methyltransferase
VIGIDLVPAQPPRGVMTFQGDFLSPVVQKFVKDMIIDHHKREPPPPPPSEPQEPSSGDESHTVDRPSYIDMERHASQAHESHSTDQSTMRLVDVRIRGRK